MNEDVIEALEDLRGEVERLPRFSDQGGIHQDNQTGQYLERNAVLSCFALYLGGHDEG
jgi:hypothetical protein